MLTKKQKGYQGEELVARYYQNKGYEILEQNYTIPGGEIDIIAQKGDTLYFIEVKVVNNLDEIGDIITSHKITALHRTIATYIVKHSTTEDLALQIDVAFVKDNHIIEVIENIIFE